MKKLIITILFLITTISIHAQNTKVGSVDNRPENNMYVNLFGDATIISINYERLSFRSSNFFLTAKVGIGYNEEEQWCIFGGCDPPEKYLTIPHHISGNYGKGRHFFEFGVGGTFINGETNQNYLAYPFAGYRLQPFISNKFIFRAFACIPFSGLETADILFVPFGLCFGISF